MWTILLRLVHHFIALGEFMRHLVFLFPSRILAVNFLKKSTSTAIREDSKSLKKLPTHLGLLLVEDDFSFQDLANIVVWAVTMGIAYISIYDINGEVKRNSAFLQDSINVAKDDIMGVDKSNYDIQLYCSSQKFSDESVDPQYDYDRLILAAEPSNASSFDSDEEQFTPFEDLSEIVNPISTTEDRLGPSITLPGRRPHHWRAHVRLLPTNCTKKTVFDAYMSSCTASQIRAVVYRTFRRLWQELLQVIPVSQFSPSRPHQACVSLLCMEDGQKGIVQVTQKLSHMVSAGTYNVSDIIPLNVDAFFQESFHLPDPELCFKFGAVDSLLGYIPWQIRLTEIISLSSHKGISYKLFLSSLTRYANSSQRYGK